MGRILSNHPAVYLTSSKAISGASTSGPNLKGSKAPGDYEGSSVYGGRGGSSFPPGGS